MNRSIAAALTPRSISWRRWVAVFFVFLLGCAALLFVSRETPGLHRVEVLVLYLLYMSVAFTFLPLPTAWIVLWAAREVEPLSVALIGTIGTCIANLHDYYIIHYLFRVERINAHVSGSTQAYQQLFLCGDRGDIDISRSGENDLQVMYING